MLNPTVCCVWHCLALSTLCGLLPGTSGGVNAAAEPAQAHLNPNLPTLFVVGDSTASNGERSGWGDPLSDYFDLTRINVANRARGGRSSRSFQLEGHWDGVLAAMKAGDAVLIQMGQNDGRTPQERPTRASLPGVGEETMTVTLPSGADDIVHTYGWYLRKYIRETRAKGATPILMSLTAKNLWRDNGSNRRPYDSYPQWSLEVAEAENVIYLDHLNIMGDLFDSLGRNQVEPLFRDSTHTTESGADLNAAGVVAGLKQLQHPVVRFLSAKGKAVAAHQPPGPEGRK